MYHIEKWGLLSYILENGHLGFFNFPFLQTNDYYTTKMHMQFVRQEKKPTDTSKMYGCMHTYTSLGTDFHYC